MTTLFLGDVWPKSGRKIIVFVSHCPKSSSKPLFDPKIRLGIQFWIPVPNLSLTGWEIKKLQKNLILDGTSGLNSGLKLEMTSYSDNAYDVTNFVLLFWKVLGLYSILTKFHCCQTPRGRVKRRGFLPPPPVHYRGIPDPIQNRVKCHWQVLREFSSWDWVLAGIILFWIMLFLLSGLYRLPP